jgi:hypothetical protein
MTNQNKNTGFTTDAFAGALRKNEEMNKNGKVKTEDPKPGEKTKAFTTDAFLEALKKNDEMNKEDVAPEP